MNDTNTKTRRTTAFKINVKTLNEALTVFRKIATGKQKMPVLNSVVFQNGTLRATNLDQEVTWHGCPAPRDFELVVELKGLTNALKGAKATDTVTIAHDPESEETALVERGNLTMQVKRFPDKEMRDPTPGFKMSSPVVFHDLDQQFVDALRYVSNDEDRFTLNGVFFDHEKGNIVATQGRTLICSYVDAVKELPQSIIIPASAAELFKLKQFKDRPASISAGYRRKVKGMKYKLANGRPTSYEIARILIADGEWEVTTKVIEGNFPNYNQVRQQYDPKESWTGFLSKEQAAEILDYFKMLPKGEEHHTVRIDVANESMTFTHKCGRFVLNPVMSPSQHSASVLFDYNFLADVLEVGCTAWTLKDEENPLTATGEPDREAIVMHLRRK